MLEMSEMSEMDYLSQTYYKYRNLSDLDRFLDIILKKRLYGATYPEMNDPMEGHFNHLGLNRNDVDEIYKKLHHTRICSLFLKKSGQAFPDNFLMWSHYADSHKGCCLEIVPTKKSSILKWEMLPIEYDNTLPVIRNSDWDEIKKILSVKTDIWKSENEVRAVKYYTDKEFPSQSAFFPVKIKSVYLGKNVTFEQANFYRRIIEALDSSITIYKIVEGKSSSGLYPPLDYKLISVKNKDQDQDK